MTGYPVSMGRRRANISAGAAAAVFARSGCQCQMPECLHPDSRALDLALRGTGDPWAPTVDHVVPLSEGGSDDRGNYRAAHFRCNQAAAGIHPAERPPALSLDPHLSYQLGEVFDPEMLDRLITEKFGS